MTDKTQIQAAANSLREWKYAQTNILPMSRIWPLAVAETQGAVMDLATGQIFEPAPDWLDFTKRWRRERRRLGKPVTCAALVAAMQRTGEVTCTDGNALSAFALRMLLLAKEEEKAHPAD